MDVHDRGMLYYRLLKHSVQEARRVVCGQHKMVACRNTIIPRVSQERLVCSIKHAQASSNSKQHTIISYIQVHVYTCTCIWTCTSSRGLHVHVKLSTYESDSSLLKAIGPNLHDCTCDSPFKPSITDFCFTPIIQSRKELMSASFCLSTAVSVPRVQHTVSDVWPAVCCLHLPDSALCTQCSSLFTRRR